MFMVKMKTENDSNGNPRSAYVLYNEEGVVQNVWDEGYRGYSVVAQQYIRLARKAPVIEVTVKQYNTILRAVFNV